MNKLKVTKESAQFDGVSHSVEAERELQIVADLENGSADIDAIAAEFAKHVAKDDRGTRYTYVSVEYVDSDGEQWRGLAPVEYPSISELSITIVDVDDAHHPYPINDDELRSHRVSLESGRVDPDQLAVMIAHDVASWELETDEPEWSWVDVELDGCSKGWASVEYPASGPKRN